MTKLYRLELQHNAISTIKAFTFMNLPSLYILELSGNPLTCDCSIFAFWSWLIERSSNYYIGSSARCSNGTLVKSLQSAVIDTCHPDNCQCFNGGKCVAMGYELICDCIGQWTGIFCQESQCISYDCGFGDCYIEPVNGTAHCLCGDIYVNYCPDCTCSDCTFHNSESTKCAMCEISKTDSLRKSRTPVKKSYNRQEQNIPRGYATASGSISQNDIGPDYVKNGREVRIVLLGRTGSGKSATGNRILGGNKFIAMVSGTSVTANCSRGECYRENRLLLVVDTPGLFDTKHLNDEIKNEISKCVGMTSPGPHAVLLVIAIGRYTKEEQDTVEHFIQHFGNDIIRYMMIVFTREDSLKQEQKTIEEFLETAPSELKEIVRKCENRYICVDNLANESEKKRKVNELITKIDDMVEKNGGVCYTNEMYAAAEDVLARRMEQIRAEFEQDQKRERRKLHNNFEQDIHALTNERSKLEDRMARMHWEKDYSEKEKQTLQMEMVRIQQQKEISQGEMEEGENRQLSERIAALRRREVLLNQQLQQKERQRLLMLSDLEKANHGIKQKRKERGRGSSLGSYPIGHLDEKTVRQKARDDVENKSPNIFTELLESLKNVGITFLSKAIKFFSNLI